MDTIQRDPALLHAYQMYELTLFDEASRLYGAKQEAKMEIALRMRKRGMSIEHIAEDTGLSIDEIAKL
jgi:predicted transposase/invertase (TIGR01784 family)